MEQELYASLDTRLGFEWQIIEAIALRAGVSSRQEILSLGGSYTGERLNLHLALQNHWNLGLITSIGAGYAF
jgi:hypothetical protein